MVYFSVQDPRSIEIPTIKDLQIILVILIKVLIEFKVYGFLYMCLFYMQTIYYAINLLDSAQLNIRMTGGAVNLITVMDEREYFSHNILLSSSEILYFMM